MPLSKLPWHFFLILASLCYSFEWWMVRELHTLGASSIEIAFYKVNYLHIFHYAYSLILRNHHPHDDHYPDPYDHCMPCSWLMNWKGFHERDMMGYRTYLYGDSIFYYRGAFWWFSHFDISGDRDYSSSKESTYFRLSLTTLTRYMRTPTPSYSSRLRKQWGMTKYAWTNM